MKAGEAKARQDVSVRVPREVLAMHGRSNRQVRLKSRPSPAVPDGAGPGRGRAGRDLRAARRRRRPAGRARPRAAPRQLRRRPGALGRAARRAHPRCHRRRPGAASLPGGSGEAGPADRLGMLLAAHPAAAAPVARRQPARLPANQHLRSYADRHVRSYADTCGPPSSSMAARRPPACAAACRRCRRFAGTARPLT